ncbi:MAG: NmrA family NAD(P)-binding protein, partial [Clostridia bacterium]|nr:NmrA family NAD(P)-binding protein [Clostridia bacterium]
MRSELTVLGSTGSIGRQTLEVARAQGFPVRALTANASLDLMEKQARAFHPELVALADPAVARELSLRLFGSGVKVLEGEEGVMQAARLDAPIVVSSIVGAAGILPTVEAIRRGARIALANKEVLVAAGSVVMPLVERCGAQFLPVIQQRGAEILPVFQHYLVNGQSLTVVTGPVTAAKASPWWRVPAALVEHLAEQSPQTLIHNLLQWLEEQRPDLHT